MGKMRFKMLAVILMTTICSSAMAGEVITYTGTETAQEMKKDADGTFHITTAGNLKWLQDVCADATTFRKTNGKKYKLMNDVVITASNWTPIGTACFVGSFDGNGKSVSGLKCAETTTRCAGFFGYVKGGTLKNLTVKGPEVSSSAVPASGSKNVEIGGIAGEINNASIINCCSQIGLLKCTVRLNGIGGIVGYVNGKCTIKGCISSCGDIEPNNGRAGQSCGGVIGVISGVNTFADVISCVSNCKKINATNANGTSSNNRRGGVIGGCGRGITGDEKGKVTVSQCWYVKDNNNLGGINSAIGCVNIGQCDTPFALIEDVENQLGSVATANLLSKKVAALNSALGTDADYKFTSNGLGFCPKN
jgi:hypothetical protein